MLLLDRPGHENGEVFAAEVSRTGDNVATFIGQDLGELESAKATVLSLAERIGGIDVLIDNATLIINRPFVIDGGW